MRKNLRHLRNLRDKKIGAHFWREPLASGQISAGWKTKKPQKSFEI